MIDDILDYISDYENVRAVCGLNSQELPDSTLGLILYTNKLGLKLEDTSGIYTPATEDQNLQEIFERVDDSSPMYAAVQNYSIYVVADAVMDSAGLRAYKTIADGKSTLTRFSAESTYQDVRQAIKDNLDAAIQSIFTLLGDAEETLSYLSVVSPDVDLVIGEE